MKDKVYEFHILATFPCLPIRRWILSDRIGSDDPTESCRIPGDGIALDSVGQICQMLQILREVVLAMLEDTLFDASDLTIGSYRQSDRIRFRRIPI